MSRLLILILACSLAASVASADSTWNHINPTPSAASFFGVASGAGRVVVTGMYPSRTSFISSNTASNWTEVNLERGYAVGSYAASYLIAYDQAWGFVAVPSAISGSGYSWIWTSTDGVQWDFGSTLVSMGNTLVAANGIFVSTGGIDVVHTSKDGGNRWASIPMDSYTNTPSVIGQTFFVPVGKTVVLSSQDGINFNVYYNFSSSIVPQGLGGISSISQVFGSPDGSISALVSTDNGGLILRSATVANPQWKIAFQWSNYIGFGYFARSSSSNALYVSIPGGVSQNEWGAYSSWVSKDNGQTWASYDNKNLGFGPIVSAGEYLVVFGKAGKLSVSQDGGQSWLTHDQGITEPIQNIWYSDNLKSLVLATNDAIYSAPDGNFTGINAVARSNPKLIGLLEFGSGSDAYFAGADKFGNISVSPVNGGHWIVRRGPDVQARGTRSYGATAFAYAEDQDIYVVAIQTFQSFSQLPLFYYTSGKGHDGWNLGQSTINMMDTAAIQDIVYADKLFAALVWTQLGKYHVLTSTNGSLWTPNKDFDIKVPINSNGCELSVAGPSTKKRFFIFCSSAQVPAYFSDDGLNWKPLSLPSSTSFVNYLEESQLWIATGFYWFTTSPDLTNWSEPVANPFGNTQFNLAAQSASTGAVVAVSTFDNTIILNTSM